MAAPARPQWLHTEGNKIVNEAGQTVVLRGVNIENWHWHWSYKKDISYERRAIHKMTSAPPDGWGANVSLLAITSGPINRGDSTYLGFLDEMVEIGASNGAYTLFVFRAHEPNGAQPNMPDDAAQNALAKLAKRYANEPAVIYGLQVEPHDVSWSQLKPRLTSMIDAIRNENPRALVAVPGIQWGRYVDGMLTDPIKRSNLILKSHVYDGVSVINGKDRFPEIAAKYPVIIGEFGIGTRMTAADTEYLLNLAESLGMSWVAWLLQEAG